MSGGTGVIVDSDNKGASFALDLKVRATARLLEDEKDMVCDDPKMGETAKRVLDLLGYEYGVELKVESEIPPDAGLGDFEAVSTATVLSVAGALAGEHGAVNELKIDKHLKCQFLVIDERVIDKKKLTDHCIDPEMRFDRVSASLYGGFIVADNESRQILRRGEMETMHAIVLIPKKTGEGEMKLFKNELELIWGEALKGNLYTAMKLNTSLYNNKIANKMLNAGALTVSRSNKGAVIALLREEDKIGDVVNSVKKEGEILIQGISNREAEIQVKPKKIVKVGEFLEMKKDREFRWL